MMTAGRRWSARALAVGLVIFALLMHGLAYFMVARYAGIEGGPGKQALVAVTGILLLSWSLMLSQAMESVTRAFYARADLDLILSSPVAVQRLFAVRIGAMTLTIVFMGVVLAAPFVNVLAARGGVHWLSVYGVVVAAAMTAAALAVGLAVTLFRAVGPKQTRLIAQIMAAVFGAAFVITMQFAAILSYGTLSRFAILQSVWLMGAVPGLGSVVWWPARAALGDTTALVFVLGAALMLFFTSTAVFAPFFAQNARAAASISNAGKSRSQRPTAFRFSSPTRALRQKEWTLLLRDPWLVSQTLMQLLYLLPPALLLWRSFAEGVGAFALFVPVLIMASGQLAGGLAWLAISGEDAPDLVAAAPVPPSRIMRAKTEAVLAGTAMVFACFVLGLALRSPFAALVTAVGIAAASASAVAIQFWFRTQAKRSQFRRRQTSSRLATFAEAFSSIGWAATGALAVTGSWVAAITGIIAIAVLGAARLISPTRPRRVVS